jgi:iron complex transport system substrate-binding protein
MKLTTYRWLLTCLLLGSPSTTPAAITLVDATGVRVTLAAPAQRIVSLAPHITELLYASGAGGQVVGATDYSDYPAAARDLPRVGGYSNIDMETVLGLRPDLVVAWKSGNSAAQVNRLRALGVAVYVSEPQRLDDIPTDIERLGLLAGREDSARTAAREFRQHHAQLARRYSKRPPVTVFYEIWNPPLMTINGKQIISDVLRLCGGVNVFADLPVLAPTVDVEAVVQKNPEAIFMGDMQNSDAQPDNHWQRWTTLRAVRAGNLFRIPADLMQRHTPRILQGAEMLCADLEQARARR